MKFIYYHIHQAISKIDLDKAPEWKATATISFLILFNILTLMNILITDFSSSIFYVIATNKFIWLISYLTIFGIFYFLYGKKDRSKRIINYFESRKKFNTIWAKSITIIYISLTVVSLYIVTN